MLEAGGLPAVEVGERARELRHVAVPVPVDARELVVALAGEHVRQLELVGSHEVHAEALAAGEGAVAASRATRTRAATAGWALNDVTAVAASSARMALRPARGDHRDARCERGHRLVEELVNVRIAHSHRSSRGSSSLRTTKWRPSAGSGPRSERWCAPRLSSRARGGAGDQPGERERVAGELVEPLGGALEAA